ncbi:hypothetical protein JTB14_022533 [Gonioctena quinquepunctata]|nr:hypothetical protein JTB14_022533 [Gonioctena quinquepunctata]
MVTEVLSREQESFLEECNLEFSERFTDSDIEYKRTYDTGIPPPPIMCPWFGKSRFNHRDRPGGSRYDNNFRNRHRDSRQENNHRDGGYHHRDRQFRPY